MLSSIGAGKDTAGLKNETGILAVRTGFTKGCKLFSVFNFRITDGVGNVKRRLEGKTQTCAGFHCDEGLITMGCLALKLVQGFRNDGVLKEEFKRDDFQGALVGGFEHDRASGTGLLHLEPACGADAPAVAGAEAGEAEMGHRCGEVIAQACGGLKELGGDDAADRMQAEIFGGGVAARVAEEAGDWVGAADLEGLAEYVFLRVKQPWV